MVDFYGEILIISNWGDDASLQHRSTKRQVDLRLVSEIGWTESVVLAWNHKMYQLEKLAMTESLF